MYVYAYIYIYICISCLAPFALLVPLPYLAVTLAGTSTPNKYHYNIQCHMIAEVHTSHAFPYLCATHEHTAAAADSDMHKYAYTMCIAIQDTSTMRWSDGSPKKRDGESLYCSIELCHSYP